MLSNEQIEAARIAVFQEHGSDLIPAVATSMARAIEAEVRKQDTALIRQLVDALEYHVEQTRPISRTEEAIAAGRARLEDAK